MKLMFKLAIISKEGQNISDLLKPYLGVLTNESIDKCLDKEYSKVLKDNMKKLSINDSSTKIYNIIKDIIK